MMDVTEERNAFPPENILYCLMVLVIFVITIKVDGIDLAARLHFISDKHCAK